MHMYNMYVCIHTYIHTYICTCMYVCMYIVYVYTCIHTCFPVLYYPLICINERETYTENVCVSVCV